VAEHDSSPGHGDEDLWDDDQVWEEDHAGRLRGQAEQVDARVGRLLARVPAVSFGALAVNERDELGDRDSEWFPGVKLLARTSEEYRLLLELRGLLVTVADRAGIGRLILRSPDGDSTDLFDATEGGPGLEELLRAAEVLDTTPGEATSEWTVQPDEVDGFHLTPAEASVYRALQELDLLFTPQCWLLHKGKRLYHLDFVVYHRGRAIALEIDDQGAPDLPEETAVRERYLRSRGLEVVHLDGGEIKRDLKGCMRTVVETLDPPL
jgi:hypothetical protein